MAKKRKYEDATIWQGRIDAWRSSGLSLTEFVERESLARSTFLNWRKALGAAVQSKRSRQAPDAAVSAFVPVVSKCNGSTGKAVTFVEVTAPPASRSPIDYGVPFEVGLRSGRRLQVPASFDADALERLIGILEAR